MPHIIVLAFHSYIACYNRSLLEYCFCFLVLLFFFLIFKIIVGQVDNNPVICYLYRSIIFLLIGRLDIVIIFFRYKGGPPLPRKLISQGIHSKSFSIEVYPLCLQLIDARDSTQSIIRISKRVLPIFYRGCFFFFFNMVV